MSANYIRWLIIFRLRESRLPKWVGEYNLSDSSSEFSFNNPPGMIPFVLKQQKEEDPDVVRGYEDLWAYAVRFYGLYPRLLNRWYYAFGIYESIMHFLYSYYVVSYSISIIIAVPYKDTGLTATLICLGVMTLIYFIVAHNFIYRRELVDMMFKIVGQGFFKYERPLTDGEKDILKKADVRCKKNFYFYNSLAVGAAFLTCVITPAVHALQGKPPSTVVEGGVPVNSNLPLPIYLPWGTETHLKYWLTSVVMIQNGCWEAGVICSACGLYCNLCTRFNAQLSLLSYSLRDLENRALYMYESKGRTKKDNDEEHYNDPIFHECMNYCLNENIKHHVVLMKFYQILQNTVSLAIFGIFSGTALQSSAPMFQLLSVVEKGEIDEIILTGLVFLSNCLANLTILASYCLYGQEVTDASDEVNSAFYETQWLCADQSFKRKILICQAMTMQPFILWAMGLISASSATLMDILKTSFSYVNLLLATL
ncbi:FACT complex subunit SSRP1 [Nesidiocoris tenuis]|uniref:Odorant receptor n=1 Tax=Nesidiocoris tenuis TaxID=355587 RepID=A0ABN7AWR6_9HEMI|nr:FACT complex subunit SSRP1 [Nesidiocoris tenuis]